MPINQVPQVSPSDVDLDWYRMVDPGRNDDWSFEEFARLRAPVQRKIAKHARDTVFVKTHCPLGPWLGVPMFDTSVTVGAIYIVRNPLDIVASYAHHADVSVDEMIDFMVMPDSLSPPAPGRAPHPLGDWSQHVATWTATPHPALHVVRYEDMVADPVKAFGDLTRFLRLPADEARLRRAIRFSAFDELSRQEARTPFVDRSSKAERFFRAGRSGAWRDELTHDQAAVVVEAHRAQMACFGYVPDGF